MRIITGSARGTKLKTLKGDDITRPTSERIKEAMFSAVQFEIGGRSVLDLFGGSGQMALEALSRGADSATIVDADKNACGIIIENAQKCRLFDKCRVVCNDWREYLKGLARIGGEKKFDLIFLDPPYKDGIIDEVMKWLFECNVVADNAIIIAESNIDGVAAREDWACKSYKYGKTFVLIMRNENTDNGE